MLMINMRQKYLVIVIVAVLVAVAIIFSVFQFSNNLGEPEPQGALASYIEFEATVISLSLESQEGYYEGDEIYRAPEDSAVIRIDKIIETGGACEEDEIYVGSNDSGPITSTCGSDFDWSSIGIEEEGEASLDFKYTVRPTKIITVVGETTQSGDIVSHTIVPTEISYEDNYFVFKVNGNSETETILPGLQEGSKFKTKLWKTFEVKIGEYEMIS